MARLTRGNYRRVYKSQEELVRFYCHHSTVNYQVRMEYIDWDLAERSIVGMESLDKDPSWDSEHMLLV